MLWVEIFILYILLSGTVPTDFSGVFQTEIHVFLWIFGPTRYGNLRSAVLAEA